MCSAHPPPSGPNTKDIDEVSSESSEGSCEEAAYEAEDANLIQIINNVLKKDGEIEEMEAFSLKFKDPKLESKFEA